MFLRHALIAVILVACQVPVEEPEPDTSTSTQAVATSGASYTFTAGSLIIPTDTTYQDQGMFLAYGLVYKLLQNKVPISWVIKDGKRLSTIAAPGGATSSGTTATFTTTSAHALAVGDPVTVRNVGVAGYNGTWTVASVLSTTRFTATITSSNLGASGSGTVTPPDFIASATDKQGGPAIVNHGYRGGPFVIDQVDAAVATPIVDAWQTANPTTKVHVATASFTGHVERQLVAAPTIAQFDDGNANIATAYLNAAKIPDSQGLTWTAASVDLLSPAEVAGPSCVTTSATIAASPSGATSSGTTATFTTTAAHNLTVGYIVTIAGAGVAGYNGTWTVATAPSSTTFTVTTILSNLAASGGGAATMNDCRGTRHDDGKLFDASGVPAYCQMMSMHWGVGAAASMIGREVVLEYRKLLQFPTHLFAECQAVNAIENNTNVAKTIAASPNGAASSGTTATFTTTLAHLAKVGDSVLVAGVGVAGYNGTWIVTSTPAVNTFTATITSSNLAVSGGGTAATYNGLFLTTSGYLIGNQPAEVDSFNFDQAYAQYDGYFETTGGSEAAYTIPPNGGYKAQDVVMLSQRKAPPSTGLNDVWMTGFLDGQCELTSEFCDPQFAQGKISYLGGHDYGTSLPISSGASQGARLFLNALLEAPCATDLGVASLNLYKMAPAASNGNQVTYSITAFNNGSSVAGNVVITDTLTSGAAFVAPASQRTITTIARATNVVTVTTSANHAFVVGDRVIVAGIANTTFNGTFVVTQVISATQFRYAQVAANASSTGGTAALAVEGACIGTSSQCSGSGGGVVTFDLGAVGAGRSTTVSLIVQFQAAATYSNTAQATYKAGVTTFTAMSNSTTTCYYAGNPSICTGGGDPNAPACSNGSDDDTDALLDFPDDPGCDSTIDDDETNAPAQPDVKGRVLIVFDTSGSMMWNTCRDDFTGGDGSFACGGADVACSPSPPGCGTTGCGNGVADDSRLWKVKTGITNVVTGFGEVEWGLMRFKQLPTAFSCGTLNVNRNDGGWQGAGASPCTGFDSGEVVVKFDPESANSLLGWMDQSTNYPGVAPIGKDYELRASGNTPLAGSLASARTYVAAARAADDPAVANCRPYRVILVTDGAETCAGNPVNQAGLLYATGDAEGRVPVHVIGFSTPDPQTQSQLDQIASQGGTTTFVPADDETQLSAALEAIVRSTILVELCNEADDDCDGRIDEDFPDKNAICDNGARGVCARGGTRVCDTPIGYGTHCTAPPRDCSVFGSCIDLGQVAEVCNKLDDDCDGKVDEAPAMNCQPCVPVGETCNNINDDCDANTDENITRQCGTGACVGTETCVAGGFTGCTAQPATPEICDGADNDCDGICDGFTADCSDLVTTGGPGTNNPGHASRSPIAQNICRPGQKTCAQDCDGINSFGTCDGEVQPCGPDTPVGTPGCDTCDGLDNDCDNDVDENFQPQQCGGNCGTAMTKCTGGQIMCMATGTTVDNTCNNFNEDCDSKFDEHWQCPDVAPANGMCDACDVGTRCNGQPKCVNGLIACEGDLIAPDVCDCKDNDCDDTPDQPGPDLCPGGGQCVNCQCAFGCATGEFPCPLGKKCEMTGDGNFCVNDPCFNVSCGVSVSGNAQTCRPKAALPNESECVETCTLINDGNANDGFPLCSTGFVCVGSLGECRPNNCTTFPDMCALNEACLNGTCVTNPCHGVTCSPETYCLGGVCVASCADVECPAGQRCRQGTCQLDPCEKPCPFGQACNDDTGQCIEDPCKVRTCMNGQWCNPNSGDCEDDPCVASNVTCPNAGEVCRGGTCYDPVDLLPDAGTGAYITVGGGGGCSSTGTGSGLLAALGLVLARRRRTKAGAR